MLFAADLFRMYSMYAESKGWKIDVVANVSETELGGIKDKLHCRGSNGAYSRLKFEAGGHRVQRVPVTESGGRIHTSAATVAVLPEVEEVDFQLNPQTSRSTYRSSGAGGQHVNKTESAIRITHILPEPSSSVRMSAASIRTKIAPCRSSAQSSMKQSRRGSMRQSPVSGVVRSGQVAAASASAPIISRRTA